MCLDYQNNYIELLINDFGMGNLCSNRFLQEKNRLTIELSYCKVHLSTFQFLYSRRRYKGSISFRRTYERSLNIMGTIDNFI